MERTGSPLVLVVALFGASCGDDDGPRSNDAATTVDARDPDASPPALEWPELSVGTTADLDDPTRIGVDGRPADFSCIGEWDWPEPGAPRPLEMLFLRDLVPGQLLPNACFRVYPDDVVDDDAPCRDADPRTDAMGRATLTLPFEAPFAIRFFAVEGDAPRDRTEHVLNVDIRPASRSFVDRSTGATMMVVPSEAGSALIPVLFGHERAPGTAILGVALRDCADEAVYGARLRVAREDGSYVEPSDARMDPAVGYFDASAGISPTQPWTHVFGVVGFLNAPPGRLFVEMWGRPAGETEPRIVACASVPAEAGRTTQVHVLEPVRRSGPACPGLR